MPIADAIRPNEIGAAVESFTLSIVSGPRSLPHCETGPQFLLHHALAERLHRAREQIVRLGAMLGQFLVCDLESRCIAAQARTGHAAQCRLFLLACLEPQPEGVGD